MVETLSNELKIVDYEDEDFTHKLLEYLKLSQSPLQNNWKN